jgi:hypothetical protein
VGVRIQLLLAVILILSSGCTRGPAPAEPQSGPLVGDWRYVGGGGISPGGNVRTFIIGDHSWWLQPHTRFDPGGRVNSGQTEYCHYWIVSESRLRVDCGAGQTVIGYRVEGDTLELDLRGENSSVYGGDPLVRYERAAVASPFR